MFGSEKNNAEEIGRLWQRLVPLEKLYEEQYSTIKSQKEEIETLQFKIKQPSENQVIAQQAARSAAQHKGKIQRTREDIEVIYNDSTSILEELKKLLDEIKYTTESFNKKVLFYDATFKNGEELFNQIKSMHEQVEQKIIYTNELLDKHQDLNTRLNEASEQLESIGEIDSKAQGILKNITSYHSKVRELRDEILGYETENEDGESERIDGIKDELASSYLIIKNDLNDLDLNLEKLSLDTTKNYNLLLETSNEKIAETLKTQENQYNDVYQKIITLLPAALTTGLSAAYNEKITSESLELKTHNNTFSKAITWLIGVSFIPFLVDLYLLIILQKDLVSVISETPKLVLSILPLYFPILWMAYSSNKKMNLSKRLIEEYTHKGVLSKTFEGLSTQIEELGDSDTSSELRVKLLFNLLHVNSENPGKLISDYKTTDHPLMDALDKSVKLGDAVEKLRNIPGFSKLTAKLEKESKDILKDTEEKVAQAISTVKESGQV
ncbi:hypothetical protein ACRN98_03565 [Shewanella oncorhynchi]|uniref:hypothetical protein n=1 Tax=Shewanella TaxID=22 RepID=UPI0021D9450C|nr:hypothetical protein [Shewanella sp. SM72]MCU8017197.1 hypothetical protein [Shewanella sp. SM72]